MAPNNYRTKVESEIQSLVSASLVQKHHVSDNTGLNGLIHRQLFFKDLENE